MNLISVFVAGFVTLVIAAVSYLYMKSAIFRYIVHHPPALWSLIKHSPKTEEEKMEAMMNDPYKLDRFPFP